VDFQLLYDSGDAYVLWNAGTDSAHGVHVDTGGLGTPGEITDFDGFGPDEKQRFLLLRSLGGQEAQHVIVTWHLNPDRSDPKQSKKLIGP